MKFPAFDAIRTAKWNSPTLLGVGPMSKLCVDATIELANFMKTPIQLIASRRQIECDSLGRGYVNNWSTEEFAKYVRERDAGDYILLARDHGGPWQGHNEADLKHDEAMERATESYRVDIKSGFDVIHLDPSLQDRPIKAIQDDIATLLDSCEQVAGDVVYECGTEETNGKTNTAAEFAPFVKYCSSLSPKIKFVVGQTGTHVKETRNVGTFDATQATKLAQLCHEKALLLKEHNLDYVPSSVLKQHRKCKIDSANVAPEFGVVETKRFIHTLKKHRKRKFLTRFGEIATQSGRWKKWVMSVDADKVLVAGHYVIAHPEVQEMYAEVQKVTDLEGHIKNDIQGAILNYLRPFGWAW